MACSERSIPVTSPYWENSWLNHPMPHPMSRILGRSSSSERRMLTTLSPPLSAQSLIAFRSRQCCQCQSQKRPCSPIVGRRGSRAASLSVLSSSEFVIRCLAENGYSLPDGNSDAGAGSAFEQELVRVESLGISARSRRLDAADPHQAPHRFRREPAFPALRLERRQDMIHLRATRRFIQRHVAVGRGEIAVVLRDFVFEDQVVPKRVPGEVRNHSVILMPVPPIVGEHEIRGDLRLQVLEVLLDLAPQGREESSAEAV